MIRVKLKDRSYDVVVAPGLLGRTGLLLKRSGADRRCIVVSSPPVWRRFGSTLKRSARRAGISLDTILVPDGERAKSVQVLQAIHTRLIKLGADRHTTLVCLGGGVIGDLGGFAAATFMRGIPVVQVPTTLIAQVDSSIGGKTGINHPLGKNLIGSFHQPKTVLVDPRLLQDLKTRDFTSGLAEVIKYGAIRDPGLFRFIENNLEAVLRRQENVLTSLVARSARNKIWYVERDEFETRGLRAQLNFGHTVGHALETLGSYRRFTHGEAVAIGMAAEAFLSGRLGVLKVRQDRRRLENILGRAGLPVRMPRFPPERIIEIVRRDKKVRDGMVRMVLMERIGRVRLVSVAERDLKKGLEELV